jgi:purine-binding chemotaxis protein CheW
MITNTFKNKRTFLSFKLKNELFAVSVPCVLEVLEKQAITTIPKTPDFFAGVINFRGEVLPVIDIRKKFNMPDRGENEKFVIIVLELNMNGNLQIGAMVDSVKDVMELSEEELKDIPKVGFHYNSEFIEGMYPTADGFMMLLNFSKILSEEEIKHIEETA